MANYISHAAAALYCFDYLITFNDEVECVWRRRFSGATVLFAVNRYAMLAASAVNLVQIVPWSLEPELYRPPMTTESACLSFVLTVDVCMLLATLAYACFASLRMFALYGMNKGVFALVFIIGLLSPIIQVCLMLNTNASSGFVAQPVAPLCLKQGLTDEAYILLMMVRGSTLGFELLLLILTWCKTFCRWSMLKMTTQSPLTTMLLRDGTMYFGVISIAAALNLGGIANVYSGRPIELALFDLVPIVDAITAICMSRFILGLRIAGADSGFSITVPRPSKEDTLRFARAETIVGNLGQSLRGSFLEDDYDTYDSTGDAGAVEEASSRSITGGC